MTEQKAAASVSTAERREALIAEKTAHFLRIGMQPVGARHRAERWVADDERDAIMRGIEERSAIARAEHEAAEKVRRAREEQEREAAMEAHWARESEKAAQHYREIEEAEERAARRRRR